VGAMRPCRLSRVSDAWRLDGVSFELDGLVISCVWDVCSFRLGVNGSQGKLISGQAGARPMAYYI